MIPHISTKGTFELIEPYNTLIDDRVIYTVTGIDHITLLEHNGINVFETVYKPVSMSNDDMLEDIHKKIPIVTLTMESGTYVQIPSDAILRQPRLDGHVYREKMLVVPMGTLPDELDIAILCEDIKIFVHDRVGINTNLNIIPTSNSILLTNEEHGVFDRARRENIRNNKSYRILYLESQDVIERMKEKIRVLEEHIKSFA